MFLLWRTISLRTELIQRLCIGTLCISKISWLNSFVLYVYVFFRIGVSEKGSANVKLSVTVAPGHSSIPPRESSIGILASAVKRSESYFIRILVLYFLTPAVLVLSHYWSQSILLQKDSYRFHRLEENPMPRFFGYGPERETFEHLAHKVGGLNSTKSWIFVFWHYVLI